MGACFEQVFLFNVYTDCTKGLRKVEETTSFETHVKTLRKKHQLIYRVDKTMPKNTIDETSKYTGKSTLGDENAESYIQDEQNTLKTRKNNISQDWDF